MFIHLLFSVIVLLGCSLLGLETLAYLFALKVRT
jgi:hypothetical protein